MAAVIPRFIFWAPRILCVLFAIFLSMFALDVFGESNGFWNTALALLMHLVPTALVALLLALAWRHEMVGAIAFAALGVLYIVFAWGRFHWSAYVGISGPLFIVGGLFFANWALKHRVPTNSAAAAPR